MLRYYTQDDKDKIKSNKYRDKVIENVFLLPIGKIPKTYIFTKPVFVNLHLLYLGDGTGFVEHDGKIIFHFKYSFDEAGRMILKKNNYVFRVLIQTNPSIFSGNSFEALQNEYNYFFNNLEMSTFTLEKQSGGKRKTQKMPNNKRGPWSSRARASRRAPTLRKRRLRRSRRGW
jgi:hypothetical protein